MAISFVILVGFVLLVSVVLVVNCTHMSEWHGTVPFYLQSSTKSTALSLKEIGLGFDGLSNSGCRVRHVTPFEARKDLMAPSVRK